MLLKQDASEQPSDGREARVIKKLFTASAAIAITFFFGIFVMAFAAWLVFLISTSTDGEMKLLFWISLAAALIVAVVIRMTWRYRQKIFWKVSIGSMTAGLSVIILMMIAAVAAMQINVNEMQQGGSGCMDLATQHGRAVAATVPIATDMGHGTAFAVDASGRYLTAYHVVEGASEVYINTVSGHQPLQVTQTAPELDIALLQGPPQEYVLGLTSSMAQADEVYAIGYPANALSAGGASVSRGIISRVLSGEEMKLNSQASPDGLEMVQTDAAVNPGNSGGPLVNRCGVVGIVSAMSDRNQLQDYGFVSEQGISYAVSSKTISERFSLPLAGN